MSGVVWVLSGVVRIMSGFFSFCPHCVWDFQRYVWVLSLGQQSVSILSAFCQQFVST
jgi:hypothetical protein